MSVPEIASPLDGALGHRLVSVATGIAVLRLSPGETALGSVDPPQLHGGTLATCVDTASWYAACSQGGDWIVSSLSVDFLRPASLDELRVTATCRRAGRTLAVVDVEIAHWDDPERVVALGRASLARIAS
ncbi:MAG: PaaI family thioesterase [Gaiellales bacterium]